MAGTEQTLFDAFGLADQQGLEGSPLDRALGIFQRNDPRPNTLQIGQTPAGARTPAGTPLPSGLFQQEAEAAGLGNTPQIGGVEEAERPGIFERVASGVGDAFEAAAPIFRGSSFLDTVLPGEPGTAVKETVAGLPVIGDFTAEALDNILSPATFLVAARGAQLASQLGRVPVVGKFAGALVDPIVKTGRFGSTFGVEGSAIIGGTALGMLAEDAPFPVQLAAGLGGALIGARTGMRWFGNVADPGVATRTITNKLHPTGTIAELKRLDGALDEVSAQYVSQTDDLARSSRGALMAESATGGGVFQMDTDSINRYQAQWDLITDQQIHQVQQMPTLMAENIANKEPVTGLIAHVGNMGKWGRRMARIFNGNVGRNPAGRAIAEDSFMYAENGIVNAGNTEPLVRAQLEEAFGPDLDLVTVKDSLTLDGVDARRLQVLEKQLTEVEAHLDRVRTRAFEGYDDTYEMWGREPRLMEQRNHLRGEINRLKSLGQYESPEAAEQALADVRKYLRQFRDGFKSAAPDQELATHSQLMTMIAENQSLFNLTDAQKEFFDQYAAFQDVDLSLNGAFRVDVDNPIDTYYVHHATDWVRIAPDGTRRPVGKGELARVFAEQTLGSRKAFQFPRTFQNSLDWMRTLERAKNPGEWNAQLDSWIDRARTLGDVDEVARLEALRNSDIVPIPRQQNFAATVSGRMAESYRARAEAIAKNVADEFGPDVRKEVDDLLLNRNISDLIRKPAEAAGFLRSTLLRMDASMMGVQGLSGAALMSGPNAGTREFVSTMKRVLASDQEFAKWWLLNGDRLSFWSMNGSVFAPNEINVVTQGLDEDLATSFLSGNFFGRRGVKQVLDPDTGEVVRTAGGAVTTAGKDRLPFARFVKTLDKIQFARGITMMKAYTNEHMLSMFKAAREDDGFYELLKNGFPNLAASRRQIAEMSDEEMARLITSFTNDIFGGRNRVVLGRSQVHQMLESIFMLTPGFTRGTLHAAINSFKPGVQGALARDYATRSLIIAGGLVTLLTTAFNGIDIGEGKFELVFPNLFDPSADDWMDVPVPGGRTIRPMSRFRSLARIVAGSAQEAAINGNWEKATQYWTDDALRWFSYRQSALVSTVGGDPIGETLGEQRGNSFARNSGLKDILFNPSTDRRLDVRDWYMENLLPIFGQSVLEQLIQAEREGSIKPGHFREIGLAAGSEFLGVGTFGPSLLESSVTSRTAELAMARGLPAEVAEEFRSRGRSALWARDDQNRYLLEPEDRDAIIAALVDEFGISEEQAARGGAVNERERRIEVEAIKSSQLGRFTDALDQATDEYSNRLAMLEQAVQSGAITPQQYSEELTKLRIRRAGARWGAEKASPAAIAFLESEERKGSQTARQQIMNAISTEAFAEDFIDPETGTFDFEARENHLDNLSAKYGHYFDEWQAEQDNGKTELELARDRAYRTLGQYFDVSDQAWQMTTGGALGASERDFDRSLNEMLVSQGVPQEFLSFARSAIKQNMPGVSEYRSTAEMLKNALRAMNPEIDRAARVWLGVQPLGAN